MTDSPRVLCTVYKGGRKQEVYLFVDRQTGLERVPQEVLDAMGELTEVLTMKLTPGRRLARSDATRVLQEIIESGYYLQLPPLPGIMSPANG